VIAAIGGVAALSPVVSAMPAYAVTTPGQDVLNDYGQSDAEVTAEVTAAVNANSGVAAARSKAAGAHSLAVSRTAAEAKALAVLKKAVKSKKKKAIAKAKKAYKLAHARGVAARAADAAAKAACAKTVASVTAAVRKQHYRPVDGTYLGAVSQYFIPSAGLEPIQVRIVVYGGHVSDVSVPVYVSTGDSAEYNAMALPILMQEAMQAHDTSTVAVVTGASLTSGAFTKSLASALVSAGFKG
jgi:NADH dehydrogenase/NADH:ubiquinone oxidoreductase subunit G